ncbi:hypothetical protein HD554DRAFT_1703373 [Boletus coccyginus]|nr:hypothetical protein HD554DRAFT_1703373 [Boletus coccyginus]
MTCWARYLRMRALGRAFLQSILDETLRVMTLGRASYPGLNCIRHARVGLSLPAFLKTSSLYPPSCAHGLMSLNIYFVWLSQLRCQRSKWRSIPMMSRFRPAVQTVIRNTEGGYAPAIRSQNCLYNIAVNSPVIQHRWCTNQCRMSLAEECRKQSSLRGQRRSLTLQSWLSTLPRHPNFRVCMPLQRESRDLAGLVPTPLPGR